MYLIFFFLNAPKCLQLHDNIQQGRTGNKQGNPVKKTGLTCILYLMSSLYTGENSKTCRINLLLSQDFPACSLFDNYPVWCCSLCILSIEQVDVPKKTITYRELCVKVFSYEHKGQIILICWAHRANNESLTHVQLLQHQTKKKRGRQGNTAMNTQAAI